MHLSKRLKTYLLFLCAIVLVCLSGAFFYQDPYYPSGPLLEAPGAGHILGTDNLGVDIFAQISMAFFSSISTGLLAAAFSIIISGILGVVAGYNGNATDTVISFIINVFLSVPQLPIMILSALFLAKAGQTSSS